MTTRLSIAFTIAMMVATGCTEANVEVRGDPIGLTSGATVSVSASDALESNTTVSCVVDALSSQETPLRVVSAKQFRKSIFDDETVRTGGKSLTDRLMNLKGEPLRYQRLAKFGLRYMILVDRPETKQEFGQFDCEGGYMGVICGASWDRDSTIRARMIDLQEGAEIGSAAAHVSGKRVLLLPIPIYIPSATEGEACKELGGAISRQLTGRRPGG